MSKNDTDDIKMKKRHLQSKAQLILKKRPLQFTTVRSILPVAVLLKENPVPESKYLNTVQVTFMIQEVFISQLQFTNDNLHVKQRR